MRKKMIMPDNCMKLTEQEMECIEGGLNLTYDSSYCTIEGARNKAQDIITQNGWSNISVEDLTAEIWCHSYAYYKGGALVNMMKTVGLDITETSVWNSVSNGIDVIDGLDTATVAGIPRYQIYRTCFNIYASMPFAE